MSNFEVLKPFGPSIIKIKMPNEMIEQINKYVDSVINDEQKIKRRGINNTTAVVTLSYRNM